VNFTDNKKLKVLAELYRNTEYPLVREYAETTIAFILRHKREQKQRRELRELINAYIHSCKVYNNPPSFDTYLAVVRGLARLRNKLRERGVDPSCIAD